MAHKLTLNHPKPASAVSFQNRVLKSASIIALTLGLGLSAAGPVRANDAVTVDLAALDGGASSIDPSFYGSSTLKMPGTRAPSSSLHVKVTPKAKINLKKPVAATPKQDSVSSLHVPDPQAIVSRLAVPDPSPTQPATISTPEPVIIAKPAPTPAPKPVVEEKPMGKEIASASSESTPPAPPSIATPPEAAPVMAAPAPETPKPVVKAPPPPVVEPAPVAEKAPAPVKMPEPPKVEEVEKPAEVAKVAPPPAPEPPAAPEVPAIPAAPTGVTAEPPAAPAVPAAPEPQKLTPAAKEAEAAGDMAKAAPTAPALTPPEVPSSTAPIPEKPEVASAPTGEDAMADGAVQVIFADNAVKLPSTAKSGLDKLAATLKDDKEKRLQLLAYAGGKDLTSSKARRVSLSRALSVRSYLIEQGIRSTRIDVRALGNKTNVEPFHRVDVSIIER